jgi:hypothetical protein
VGRVLAGAPGDVVPVSRFGSYEVQFGRGGRLRVNRGALVTSAASGCLMGASTPPGTRLITPGSA